VTEDTGIVDWASRYAAGGVATRHGRVMRIAVAQR